MKRITKKILDRFSATSDEWAVIHKIDEILKGTENDVDIIVTDRAFPELKEEIYRTGCTIIRTKFMLDGISYVLYDQKSHEILKLDIIKSPSVLMFSYPIRLNPKRDIEISHEYPLLSKGKADLLYTIKTKYRQDIFEFLYAVITFRLRLNLFKYSYSIGRNFLAKPGKTVLLVGPDGSGKTTVLIEILKEAKNRYFAVEGIHFSEGIFPRLSRLALKKKVEPDYTKKDSGTFAPIQPSWKSNIYAIYYGIELAIYSRLYTRRKRNLGRLQVFDRYYHDMLFQRSYRSANKKVIKFFLMLSVRPDIVVFLAGSPSSIRSRKPELSTEEIALQQHLITNYVMKYWEECGVECLTLDNANKSLNYTLSEILNQI